jgi:hypothetical protein
MTDRQLELPGLELDRDGTSDGPMVAATRQTLREWQASGVLMPHHAVLTQLMLSLSQAIDAGARNGRAAAVAMAAAQLRETVLQINPPATEGVGGQALVLLHEFLERLPQPAHRSQLEAAPDGG